jgi:putative transposase
MLYHIVCPVKYRKEVITKEIAQTIRKACEEISACYEIHFVEIGTDEDHVHFLTQSVPMMRAVSMVQTIKSITAKEIFKQHKELKEQLKKGKFWTSGYYINTVGRYGNETVISNYVKNQGRNYNQIYRNQLTLFEGVE